MAYDDQNVFAKILRGEIPCKKVYEDEFALAFHDINPMAPVHVLVIPKGPYQSFADFGREADAETVAGFFQAVNTTSRELGLDPQGYRILANHGRTARQEVGHFHVHIFGGTDLGPMISRVGG